MNSYEEKIQRRRERYESLAEKAKAESIKTGERAAEMASIIPMGQPILVGHHSEKRDRRYRDRIWNTFGKSVQLERKAAYYAERAASVGTGGISSDDPEAVEKLREKLANLESLQEKMKSANKAIRKHKTPEDRIGALVALGFSEVVAEKLLTPDYCGGIGFADYETRNNNANIRRLKGRIAELEAIQKRDGREEEGDGYTYREDGEEKRVMFIFGGKPSEEIRTTLKRHGFKWSPTRGAWVRHLNANGIWAAKQVKEAIRLVLLKVKEEKEEKERP